MCVRFKELAELITPYTHFYHANIIHSTYHQNIMKCIQSEIATKETKSEFVLAYLEFAVALKQYNEYVKSQLGSTNGY